MIDAISYDDMLEDLRNRVSDTQVRRPIGILLGDPNCDFVKNNILKRINYYHERSNSDIDFYFPGYGAYWNGYYPDAQNVCMVDWVEWSFSSKKFCEFIEDLETKSKWKYSGETELLILDYHDGNLDFSNVMVNWLDRMVEDKVIYSAANFFETIFRYFKDRDSTFDVSDKLTLKSLSFTILDLLKQNLPLQIGKIYDKSKYYCTRNLSK